MTPYSILAVIGVCLVIAFGGWEVRGFYDTAHIETAIAKQEAAVVVTERNQVTISNQQEAAYEGKVTTIDTSYDALFKRLYALPSGSVSPVSTATGKLDSATCNNKISKANSITLAKLAQAADIQTQRLISLQEWVKAQGK
jgi:hypothetical protein